MNSLVFKKNLLAVGNITLTVITATVIPYVYHLLNLTGNIYLPIYLAVLVGSFIFSTPQIIIIALLTPLANYLISGMPQLSPFPMLQILTIELIVLSLTSLYVKKTKLPLIIQIIISILAARLSSILLILFSSTITFNWWSNHILISIPGIILNSILCYLILWKFDVQR